MNVLEFKTLSDDLGAGFTHWSTWQDKRVVVVGCRVFSSEIERPAWVAAAADSRSDAAGVHGLKFNVLSFPGFSEELVERALARPGEVVARLPAGDLVHLIAV